MVTMADTIDIGGKHIKKTYVYLGVAATAVVGYALYRRQKNASAAATPASSTTGTPGTSTDPAGNVGTINPATGFVYGSAEDQAALQSASAGAYGGYGGYGGGYGGYGNYGNNNGTGYPQGFTNNAQWAQAAEQYITGGAGGAGSTDPVGNALGKYLTGGELTPDQVGIVNQAIAFEGYPPVSGPNGYPPSMRTSPNPPPPGNTNTVPNVMGQPAGEAFNVITAAGLSPHEDSPNIRPDWIINSQTPRAGTKVRSGSQVRYNAKSPQHPVDHGPHISVPNVVGMTAGEAHNAIVASDLRTVDPNAGRRGEPQRRVRSQSPRDGTIVASGSNVTIHT